MSEFQFQKSQRVMIPGDIAGAECVWGVVAGYHAKLGREPFYDVQWQSVDAVDEHFNLIPTHATVSESRLMQAQPAPSLARDAVDKLVATAYRQGADDIRTEQEQERQARASKRKASARKRTRK